jgi:hypothetical protein
MTLLYDPRPLESPDYWVTPEASSYSDFCELVADELARKHGWNTTANDLKGNYYIKREYYFGESVEATAELFYEFEIIWED